MFGTSIDYGKVRIRRRKWFPFHLRKYVMAPTGHLHFHPQGEQYCDDFSTAPISRQALFIHEMTHVWQHQKGLFLLLRRHPFSRYWYMLRPGWTLECYGIEQQAEIVKHAFLLRRGEPVKGACKAAYDALVRFPGAER